MVLMHSMENNTCKPRKRIKKKYKKEHKKAELNPKSRIMATYIISIIVIAYSFIFIT